MRKTVMKQLLYKKIRKQMQKIQSIGELLKAALYFSAIAKDAKKLKKFECLLFLQFCGNFVSFNFQALFIIFAF